jgi:hypothetical protein
MESANSSETSVTLPVATASYDNASLIQHRCENPRTRKNGICFRLPETALLIIWLMSFTPLLKNSVNSHFLNPILIVEEEDYLLKIIGCWYVTTAFFIITPMRTEVLIRNIPLLWPWEPYILLSVRDVPIVLKRPRHGRCGHGILGFGGEGGRLLCVHASSLLRIFEFLFTSEVFKLTSTNLFLEE